MTSHRLKFIGLVMALSAATLLALYAAAGFLLLPWLAQRYVPPYLEQRLGRSVSAASIHVNPFLLQVEVRDLRVEGRHGRPVVASERLFADLALSGLFRRAWTVDEVRIEGLQLHVVVAPDGSLNVLDMAERLQEKDGASGKSTAFVIHSLAVPDAGIVLTDLTGAAPASVAIDAVSLEAEGIGTLGQERGRHRLNAKLPAGGTLQLTGELALQPSLAAEGEVRVTDLKAETLWPFVRDELRLSELRATSSFTGRYAYDAEQSLRLSNVTAELSGLVLAGAGSGDRLLALENLAARGGSLDLARRSVSFNELTLDKGRAHLAIAPDGSLNWASLVAGSGGPDESARAGGAASGQAAPSNDADAGPGWSLAIEEVRIAQVGVNAIDRSRKQPLELDVGELDARMKLSLDLQGSTQVVADRVAGTVKQVSVGQPDAQVRAITITSASLQAGHFDLQARELRAHELAVEGGHAALRRQRDGTVPLLDLLAGSAAASDENAGRPWRYALDSARVASFDLRLEDQRTDPPMALGAVLQASAAPVTAGQPVSVEASLALDQGGKIRATGSIAPGAGSAQAQVTLESVALTPFQPLLAQYAALSLQSGAVSASLAMRYQQAAAEPLTGKGSLRVADLLVREAASGDRFLSWRQLDAQGVDFALGARTLSIRDVTVDAPGAKIVIAQDRSVNLAQVMRTGGQQVAKAAGNPPPQPVSSSPGGDAPPLDFRIEQVRFRNGVVDYADLSLVLPFSTQVTGLQGVIAGITSDPARHADVKATGGIPPYGSASIEGSIAPSDPSRFTDLRVAFNNVLVPPLSPYTATFAGRKVESGRLWLDLDYKIENGEILGSNDIRLANFKLGEQVEAPDAMDVPLNLAVALLTDSKGEIKLSVPVRGDLDSPKFSVADAVKQALGNVLRRVVTAPFRALGKLFGGNPESLASIEFRPGSAQLSPEQQEKLDALTRALQERPQLKLVVSAPHDPQADAAMLRRELAHRELAAALGRAPASGEDPGPIAYDDPATRRALEQLLQERVGAERSAQLATEAGRAKEGAGTGPRAAYEKMFDEIAAAQPLRDTATQVLASQRARTVAQYLQRQGVDPARVQTGRIAEVQAGSQGSVAAQLQVAAAGDSG